jgi:hypothetical protein
MSLNVSMPKAMSTVTDTPARHRRVQPSARDQLNSALRPLTPRTRRSWIGLVGLVLVIVAVVTVALTTTGSSSAAAPAPAPKPPVASSQPTTKALQTSELKTVLPSGWEALPACTTQSAAGCERYQWVVDRPETVYAAMQLRSAWTGAGFRVTTATCQRASETARASCLVIADHGIGGTDPVVLRADVAAYASGSAKVTISANSGTVS